MALESLATVDDLAEMNIQVSDPALAEKLLASVSASVRDAAGGPITKTVSTISIPTVDSRRLVLPGRPVRSVSIVALNGGALAEGVDYAVRLGCLWSLHGPWHRHGQIPGELTVTLEHGLDDVPADIVSMVCMYVAAGLAAAADGFEGHRGLQYYSVDDYREGYLSGTDEVVDPTDLTERTRANLRERFGTGGPVVYGGAR